MNRTTNGFAKPGFASRPVRVALAMKIAFAILAVNVGFAAAKALLVKAPEPHAARVVADGSPVKPFILPIDWAEPAAVAQSDRTQGCRGLADQACRKAL